MNETESKISFVEVVKALAITAEVYDKVMSKAAAMLMANDLREYPAPQVIEALAKCRRELRNFPTVADIVSRIPGQAVDLRSESTVIAGKILEAASKFGLDRVKEARDYVGEVGWATISMSGGWASICHMTDKEIGVFKAQWIQLTEALLKRGPVTEKKNHIEVDQRVRDQIQLPKFPKEEK